ncbi:DUF2249 domain-containing protein [Arthrobacter sp. 24S4-2]|uniref:DUF2249 domain-containing protein n=1 Tax=Arthrobacter sp. 24S4-2 TaxID=2575374 RepID=UPI0010C78B64|nr:DUF2249 domain-containing protein [Arthrobacter sp. 24S4-2]QCO99277.1 DUF2249 domain-containing protein [Arthrobacter sp. 24S4-2]
MMAAGNHTVIAVDAEALLAALPVSAGAVRSTRVFKGEGAGVVRLTFDEGAVMREHTAAAPILLQVLSGHVALDVGGERVDLPAGAIIHLDANLPHSLEALTRAHLLLTICERAPATTRAPKLDSPATVDAPAAASMPEPARRSNLVLASSGPDSDAVERVTARHAELSGSAAIYTTQLIDAAVGGDDERTRRASATLLDWSRGTLGALLEAEQEVIDPAISRIDVAVVHRLRTERELVTGAIWRLANLSGHVEVASVAVELRMHLGQHLRFFADHALPVLARTGGLSLGSLWSDIESLMVDDGAPASKSATQCECGIVDEPAYVELDVRNVPHAIRHATVFGALDAIGAGEGLILVAPHDPLSLLIQVEQRTPGRFTVSYLDRGPEAWRLQFSAAYLA